MSVSSSARSSEVPEQSGPDFLEFLQEELNAPPQDVTALLGRWLVEYRPLAPREIQVLRPRSGAAQHAAFSAEMSP